MSQFTGILLVVLAAICFGFMGLFGSWAMRDGVSVEMLLFLRFAIAGAAMAIVMAARRARPPRGQILLGLIGMGAALYVGEALFFFHAMKHIPVGLVSLLLYIYPVVVTLFAWLVWKERLTHSRIVALGLAIAGLALTIVPTLMEKSDSPSPDAQPTLGVLLGFGCCISYAVYILVGGPMTRRAGAIPASTIVIISAAVVLGIIAIARGDSLPHTAQAWLGVILLAMFSTVIAITCVLSGLERIGPVQTSTLSTLEPVATVLVGVLLMGQKLTLMQIAGGALIVCAAIIIARGSRSSTPPLPTNADVIEVH